MCGLGAKKREGTGTRLRKRWAATAPRAAGRWAGKGGAPPSGLVEASEMSVGSERKRAGGGVGKLVLRLPLRQANGW